MAKTVVKSLRVDPEIWVRLETQAARLTVSVNALATVALRLGVGQFEDDARATARPLAPVKPSPRRKVPKPPPSGEDGITTHAVSAATMSGPAKISAAANLTPKPTPEPGTWGSKAPYGSRSKNNIGSK
jgi:hypothetical protein